MTEVRKESLSALLDGEASEIEVHRLVREFRDDDSLTTSWAMYQQIRTTVRAESQFEPEHHSALFARISSAIEEEDAHTDSGASFGLQRSGLKRAGLKRNTAVAGSLALAASLVIAVFIGVQPGSDTAQSTIASVSESSPGMTGRPAVSGVQMVANPGQGLAASSESAMPELVELDEEKQRRLRAYLNQHDRMSRMNTQQQFVNHTDASK